MENNNTKSTVDFSKQNQADLLAALRNINKDKFPSNYAACLAEIDRRKQSGDWKTQDEIEKNETKNKSPFSIRRRIFSYVLDSVFIALIALCFFPLSDFLNGLGYWGVIPFWILTITYGTLLDGAYGKGQTFGKRITNLKIVSTNGTFLSSKMALTRGVYLAVLVGMRFGMYNFFPKNSLVYLFDFGLIAFWLFDLLCMWKHPQNRSLMDILTGSIIHDSKSQVAEVIDWKPLLDKKSWFIVGAAFVLVGFYFSIKVENNFENQLNMARKVEENTPLKVNGYGKFKSYKNGGQVAEGENYLFSLPPALLSNTELVMEYSIKARELLLNENPSGILNGTKNIIIVGHIFKGLLPINYTYRNYDLKTNITK